MTIKELIENLQDLESTYGPNVEVMTSSNYGDYSKTEQLNHIASIEINEPIESAYSQSGLAFNTEDSDDDSEFDYDTRDKEGIQERESVLVLRYTN